MRGMLRFERRAYQNGATLIAGHVSNEAGRGPLAVPSVAAAVILPRQFRHRNAERFQATQPRAARVDLRRTHGSNGRPLGGRAPGTFDIIDHYNILGATWRAMQLALYGLRFLPDHVLVDGLPAPLIGVTQTAIIALEGK